MSAMRSEGRQYRHERDRKSIHWGADWLKAFDGKKMVPNGFMNGVASCIPMRTINQEEFHPKAA